MERIESEILQRIKLMLQQQEFVLIAIDGRCCAGKTTLASRLQQLTGCNVLHMDHFFLRPEQRTAERLNTPGGNVDYERFFQEVFIPLRQRKPLTYHPYDCHIQAFSSAITVKPAPINIIEGTYSCHPLLRDGYDLRIFLSVSADEQRRRIIKRNADSAELFFSKWIPLEEHYFTSCGTKSYCDLQFDTYEMTIHDASY